MHATPPPPTHSAPTAFAPLPDSGICRLDHLGVIEVSGEDNIRFLNGQLSNDLTQLSPTQARLAAFCSAKGRMQASFVVLKRDNGDLLMVCSRDLLANTQKRLSMFVMRAKAKLRDASADFSVFGLLGQSTTHLGDTSDAPWVAANVGAASVVQLYPAQGLARQLWLAPADAPAPTGPALALPDWQSSEVLSGVATVSADVVEAFVPQMLNYESVGGVSFKKGCYPGQEVVARSQFRGTLKRRAYLVQLPTGMQDGLLQAGQEVFSSQDPDQPCGLVVQAAPSAHGRWLAIVSIQTNAAEHGELHLGSAGGAPVELLPLPYALLEDI
ncbi:MAG: folate-binding protein [Rhodoferax sp.]|nr:folate-binding protein [Rhodoferax sp.]